MGSTSLSSSCHTSFVKELASHAFRKRISDEEVNRLSLELWDDGFTKQEQIQTSFLAITSMPEFIYRAHHHGNPIAGSEDFFEMTSFDLASRLSYFLTGSAPDATLRALAANNQILNKTVLEAQVDRLLSLSEAEDSIVRFFRESYGYELFESFSYPGSFRNGISVGGLVSAMTDELDEFFIGEVLERNSGFSELFTSTNSKFNHDGLASIYSVTNPEGGSVNLPAQRAGFLNRAGMLTKRSGLKTSSIKRGLKVLENVLCVDVGPPPPSAPTDLPELIEGEYFTTRDHTFNASQVVGTACITCHARMDPLGFAFENFDTLGWLRTMERIFDNEGDEVASLPVNTSDRTLELNNSSVNFSNSVELSSEIGESDKGAICFVKHLKEFESREKASILDDGCHMNEALDVLYGDASTDPGSIKDAIKAYVLSQSFRVWSK